MGCTRLYSGLAAKMVHLQGAILNSLECQNLDIYLQDHIRFIHKGTNIFSEQHCQQSNVQQMVNVGYFLPPVDRIERRTAQPECRAWQWRTQENS